MEGSLAGSLSLTFFFYVFVNTAMVVGLMPIVGILPLVSYGGTSMVTLMVGFGMLMSINSNRKLVAKKMKKLSIFIFYQSLSLLYLIHIMLKERI